MRELSGAEAIREALEQCMRADDSVIIVGLGVADPKAVFGTVSGLLEQFGPDRVVEPPTAENGTSGIALGAAVMGMRPVVTHQRVEFALLAMDPMVNQAAKWHYMTGGRQSAPLVFRLVIGRGWGQGPQHSQSLESVFAHIPGLKVVTPATPADAKGLLISSIRDDSPVVFLEHRWTHLVRGPVAPEVTEVPIGKARIARPGNDLTIVTYSHTVVESLIAAQALADHGISAEVVDLRSLRPLDMETVCASLEKTRRLLVVDLGWSEFGISSEVISHVAMDGRISLECPPRRLGLAPVPVPSTRALANDAYPTARTIAELVAVMMESGPDVSFEHLSGGSDVPDPAFRGPF